MIQGRAKPYLTHPEDPAKPVPRTECYAKEETKFLPKCCPMFHQYISMDVMAFSVATCRAISLLPFINDLFSSGVPQHFSLRIFFGKEKKLGYGSYSFYGGQALVIYLYFYY